MTCSVIIPTLNEERTIGAVLAHTSGLGFEEILVVDGGSSDRTVELVRDAGRARLIAGRRGRAGQLNEGAKAARGDVLVFLHADTFLPADARRAIESALADLRVTGGRFDVTFDRRTGWARLIGAMMNLRSRVTGICTGDQAIFVRRVVFERLGGYADIPLMEDIEFSRRLKRTGRPAALRDAVTTSFRRWEQRGPLRTVLLMWTLRFLYWCGVSPHRLQRFYAAVR